MAVCGQLVRIPMRVLVAHNDASFRSEFVGLMLERFSRATIFPVSTVPGALEALLVRHPNLVVTDLDLSGHILGGFRLILDAVSLGVPTVVLSGQVSQALRERLDNLGVKRVPKGESQAVLLGAVDCLLRERPRTVPTVRHGASNVHALSLT